MLWPRQRGKTEGVASCGAGLLIMYGNVRIGVMSNNEENSKEFILRVKRFLLYSIFADWIVRDKTDRIELKNGSVIISFPQTENIRGQSLTWLFIDECAQIKDSILDGAALPTTRTAGRFRKYKTPSIILLSTPRGNKGRFIDYYIQGLGKREIGCLNCHWKKPISDYPRIKFHPREIPKNFPPCPECGESNFVYVPNNIITVTVNPWNDPNRTPEEIQTELDTRGNTPLARQELLAEIVSEDLGVFTRDLLEANVDHTLRNKIDPKIGIEYVISADFGKTNDATVIAIGHKNDGIYYLDYMKYIPSKGGLEFGELIYNILYMVYTFKPVLLVLDATGLGMPLVEHIRNLIWELSETGVSGSFKKNGTDRQWSFPPCYTLSTKIYSNKPHQLGFIFDYKSKTDLISNLTTVFERGMMKIPYQHVHNTIKILWKELLSYEYENSNNNKIIYGTQREHDDTVIALALLSWGLRQSTWYYAEPLLGERDQFVLQ